MIEEHNLVKEGDEALETLDEEQEAKPLFKPYEEMVELLFKTPDQDSNESAMLMHAAIGVIGETVELHTALDNKDHENILEELGDYCFYMQKVLTHFGYTWDMFESAQKNYWTHVYDHLLITSNDLLDVAKKYWVYNKPVDAPKIRDILQSAISTYLQILELLGTDLHAVQIANQIKLAKRYPQGVYTDADAQARADKIQEAIIESIDISDEGRAHANP